MGTRTAEDRTTAAIAAALLAVAKAVSQHRTHDSLCRQAGVDLDRGGAELLYKLYAEGDDVRLSALAERLGIDSPAVTRKVQQLERVGLVARSADPADARASRLTLTCEGRLAIERLLAVREQWFAELLEAWTPEDRHELARLLHLLETTIVDRGDAPHGA